MRVFQVRRLLGFVAALCCSLSCSPPQTPPVPGSNLCSMSAGQSRPLTVEWSAPDRTDVEARTGQGPILVERRGCDMRILRGCRASGAYRYTPVTPKHDRVIIRNMEELYVNLPLGASKLEAKLGQAGRLDVAMTIVGQHELDRTSVPRSELSGDCTGATHAITLLTAGAFELLAGASSTAGAGIAVGGMGAGVNDSQSREVLSRDGDVKACALARATDTKPPEGCAALIRIELVPIGEPRRTEPMCPQGWKWNGVQCEHPGAPSSPCPDGTQPVGGVCRGDPSPGPTQGPSPTQPSPAPTPPPPAPPQPSPGPSPNPAAGPMVRVPGGTFRLGSNEGYGFHSPQHLITIGPFEIDMTEVTLAAYRRCVNAGACVPVANESVCNWGKDGRENDPINCVTYEEAAAYCKWAGKRLPTEEEWEFAALGQSGWKYPWGNAPPGARICWKGHGHARPIGEREGTCPVDRFPEDKSQFGVRNLVGNVSEWTSSPVCAYPKKEHKCETDSHIIRGGAWGEAGNEEVFPFLRKRARIKGHWSSFTGFRCARTP